MKYQSIFLFHFFRLFVKEYLRKAAPYVEGGYNDIDPGLNPALQDHYRITPSPGGPGDQYGRFVNRKDWKDQPSPPLQVPHVSPRSKEGRDALPV